MRFSVIIPLYNKAPYVAKAIGSVLTQTFTDFELAIVDDGSKDNSAQIAERAIEGCDNCRLIRQENAGVSMARNNGVSLSQGEYLCFLDADDWWAPTFLEEMSKLIDEFPDAGIYGTGYTIVNETRHKTRVSPIGVESGFEKGYINYCQVYAKTLAMPLTSISVAVPRLVFDEMEGFPKGIKLGEDFLLWIRIALKYKVVLINRPLSFYNQDVDAVNRGVGKLHNPEEHMLWNVDFLAEEEKTNPDYKQLIDNLRTYGLLPYYLSKEYHEAAQQELKKVDWSRQHAKTRKQYSKPLSVLRLEFALRRIASNCKRHLIGH
jgi:glycosyltransferase involved in cell wall biosynthesis